MRIRAPSATTALSGRLKNAAALPVAWLMPANRCLRARVVMRRKVLGVPAAAGRIEALD